MSTACPDGTENLTDQPALLPLEDWMLEPGRSEIFQAFCDSLLGKGETDGALNP